MRVKVINKRPASVLQKKRVCAYARVSTDSRRQEDSLENQMETYERLITGNPEYEFIGVILIILWMTWKTFLEMPLLE